VTSKLPEAWRKQLFTNIRDYPDTESLSVSKISDGRSGRTTSTIKTNTVTPKCKKPATIPATPAKNKTSTPKKALNKNFDHLVASIWN
jgi:hypothetical protein